MTGGKQCSAFSHLSARNFRCSSTRVIHGSDVCWTVAVSLDCNEPPDHGSPPGDIWHWIELFSYYALDGVVTIYILWDEDVTLKNLPSNWSIECCLWLVPCFDKCRSSISEGNSGRAACALGCRPTRWLWLRFACQKPLFTRTALTSETRSSLLCHRQPLAESSAWSVGVMCEHGLAYRIKNLSSQSDFCWQCVPGVYFK